MKNSDIKDNYKIAKESFLENIDSIVEDITEYIKYIPKDKRDIILKRLSNIENSDIDF